MSHTKESFLLQNVYVAHTHTHIYTRFEQSFYFFVSFFLLSCLSFALCLSASYFSHSLSLSLTVSVRGVWLRSYIRYLKTDFSEANHISSSGNWDFLYHLTFISLSFCFSFFFFSLYIFVVIDANRRLRSRRMSMNITNSTLLQNCRAYGSGIFRTHSHVLSVRIRNYGIFQLFPEHERNLYLRWTYRTFDWPLNGGYNANDHYQQHTQEWDMRVHLLWLVNAQNLQLNHASYRTCMVHIFPHVNLSS